MTLTISVWSDKLKSVGLLFEYINEENNIYKYIRKMSSVNACHNFKKEVKSITKTFYIDGSHCTVIFSQENANTISYYTLDLITKENKGYYHNFYNALHIYNENSEIDVIREIDLETINNMNTHLTKEITNLKEDNIELKKQNNELKEDHTDLNEIISYIKTRLEKLEKLLILTVIIVQLFLVKKMLMLYIRLNN